MATAEFKVFHGVGAIIARVTSHTKFSVLAIVNMKPIDFSATDRLFEVDLNATPRTMGTPGAVTTWADVKFDDRGVDKFGKELPAVLDTPSLRLGMTTLGSGVVTDMKHGGFLGAVYIEHNLFESLESSAIALPGDPHPWPRNSGLQLHQITSIAYSNNEVNGESKKGRRYHGFQARVLEVADGGKTIKVEFPHFPGPGPTLGPSWFRLDDPAECDNDPPPEALGGAPSIVADPRKDLEGAFFVALPRAASLALSGPKLPIGDGG